MTVEVRPATDAPHGSTGMRLPPSTHIEDFSSADLSGLDLIIANPDQRSVCERLTDLDQRTELLLREVKLFSGLVSLARCLVCLICFSHDVLRVDLVPNNITHLVLDCKRIMSISVSNNNEVYGHG